MRMNYLTIIGLLVLLFVGWTCTKSSEQQDQQAQQTVAQNAEPVQQQVAPSTQVVQQPVSTRSVIIYDEQPAQGARYWIPSGWMPDGGGISFNDSFEGDNYLRPHSGRTCIKFGFYATQRDWVGIYWLYEGRWEPQSPAPNIFTLLNIKKGARVRLKLFARGQTGGESVQFKAGGISKGKYPDSLTPVVETPYIRLTNQWQEYTLDLTTRDLTNLVGGFCVVLDRFHNPNRNEVWFYLDDIVIETF